MSIHFKAIKCLERAEKLIDEGGREALSYASLELRLAIESWFYDIRKQYIDHLPETLHGKWQPHQLMKAIEAIDPESLCDRKLTIFPDAAAGAPGLTFQARNLSTKEIKKHHNSLGKYLHADLNCKLIDLGKWRDELQEVARCLDRLRDANAVLSGHQWILFPCECGLQIKRAQSALKEGTIIECIKEDCQKQYRVSVAGEEFRISPEVVDGVCPMCNGAVFINRGFLRADAVVIQCHLCAKDFGVVPGFTLQPAKA